MPRLLDNAAGVNPVIRSLMVLEAMNATGKATTLAQLHEETGLPKPTLVRLLDTLISTGHVRRVSRMAGYALTERVLRLSSGFRHGDLVVEAARPFLSALTAEHKWPMGLATLDRDAMLVRLSTRQESPFAMDPDWLNRRLAILVSALARAYIAFCPEEERRVLLTLLRNSKSKMNAPARDESYMAAMVEGIRKRGYANTAAPRGDPAMGLAVPVMQGEHVAACINIRYIGSTMSEAEAVKRYLPALQRTAAAIAANLEERSTAS
ncbi:regulatory protein IclR [Parvibaculum lavamentivorans DS-1]|uniref:Regulatory protein IclR n=1 Tax=Parvibaculum lavamentivorans (strain DS-1 / DSM 13023 / NCIMB 13966) TaxID=402881 RepID=A7HRC4_PARL1|nr:DNA-binding transcriptional regulator [Parvibaculum lavamentivorans]ABS62457.1 regulatory protein IclR [Parvibaculum lavamentivorans DS-1]